MPYRRAVILAGGKGTRLRPYTVVLPKPLMPIGDHPIMEVIIRQLATFKYDRVTIAVNHQADLIKAFFDDGRKWHLSIDYSLEPEPLSTIGPLKLIPDLPEHFLLINGDVLTDLDLGHLFENHVAENRLFTIAAACRTNVVDYGVLEADASGTLRGFREKPAYEFLCSMGVYVVNRKVLEWVPEGRRYGFDDLMLEMLRRQEPVRIETHPGYWLDIGRVDDYMQAIDDFERRKSQLIPDA